MQRLGLQLTNPLCVDVATGTANFFLRAKLFKGLAEEKDKLPGWSEDGMINECGSANFRDSRQIEERP